MAMITRLSRLFTADFHAVLDRLEEPDVLLRQAVREMEDELAHCEQQLNRLRHEHQQLTRRETEIAETIDEIDEQLDLCFASGEEMLAKTLVKRKLPQVTLKRTIRGNRENVEREIEAARGQLIEQRQRFDGIRQKAELLSENFDSSGGELGAVSEFAISEADVDVAFLKEKRMRSAS